jgi:alanine-glyoxylate transaminase / serine-glyoxylate transaminase / serine-pyruvate transaminase
MSGRNFLFVPGPTNVPDRVLRAMHRAMEDHRSSDFPSLAGPAFEDLKKIFKTRSAQPFIFPASGTGAWEAALSNTLSPGDKVLAARFGMFSHLWIDMAQRLGLDVLVLDAEWGEGAPIERYQEALAGDKSHQIKAVLFTHNETATGVTSDVAGMRRGAWTSRSPALRRV